MGVKNILFFIFLFFILISPSLYCFNYNYPYLINGSSLSYFLANQSFDDSFSIFENDAFISSFSTFQLGAFYSSSFKLRGKIGIIYEL